MSLAPSTPMIAKGPKREKRFSDTLPEPIRTTPYVFCDFLIIEHLTRLSLCRPEWKSRWRLIWIIWRV